MFLKECGLEEGIRKSLWLGEFILELIYKAKSRELRSASIEKLLRNKKLLMLIVLQFKESNHNAFQK